MRLITVIGNFLNGELCFPSRRSESRRQMIWRDWTQTSPWKTILKPVKKYLAEIYNWKAKLVCADEGEAPGGTALWNTNWATGRPGRRVRWAARRCCAADRLTASSSSSDGASAVALVPLAEPIRLSAALSASFSIFSFIFLLFPFSALLSQLAPTKLVCHTGMSWNFWRSLSLRSNSGSRCMQDKKKHMSYV